MVELFSTSNSPMCVYQCLDTAMAKSEPMHDVVVPVRLEVPLESLAPTSPRQEALSLMADKKRQKWMREKGTR
jgi:hypothetical protein